MLMLDKLKKLVTGEPTKGDVENKKLRDLYNEAVAEMSYLNTAPPYYVAIKLLKENGYVIDNNVCLTEKDTDFIQITVTTDTNFIQITVPDDMVLLLCRGRPPCTELVMDSPFSFSGYTSCVSINGNNFRNLEVEIVAYNPDLQLFRFLSKGFIGQPMVFDRDVVVKSTSQLKWRLLHPVDVDIKKESIRFSGRFDVCVHKDAQKKFPWWKDGKFVHMEPLIKEALPENRINPPER